MLRSAFPVPAAWRRASRESTPPAEPRVQHDRTLSQVVRGLTWIGSAFLVASAAVVVWAVFRTVGVDDLLVALTVAGLGLGLPAIAAFVIAWILHSLGQRDAEVDEDAEAGEIASPARAPLANVAWGYAAAVLACIAAWGLRVALDPLLGLQVTYAPLLLSVAFAAWYGGLGPAVLATLLGAGISWFGYLSPRDRYGALSIDDAVQLGSTAGRRFASAASLRRCARRASARTRSLATCLRARRGSKGPVRSSRASATASRSRCSRSPMP